MEIKDKELHRIAVTGIIYNDEGKYLITRRALTKKASPGKWTVPGGGLNIDDYINLPSSVEGDHPQWYGVVESTLRREIKASIPS
jgi:8-oxo-dGTP pyrophosphatase MutT (NUDIX family)